MGNAHFPSVAVTVAFIRQPFGMIQSMEQQHVHVSATKQRQPGHDVGEYTKELEEMKMAVQREQRRRKKRRGREEEGQTADKAIVINSDDSETEPSPKRVRAERSSSRQQVEGRQQQAAGSGQPGEREMGVSTAAPRWKPVSSSGSHTQVQ